MTKFTRGSITSFNLLIAYLFFATFCIVLPLVCGDWAYSWYFSSHWTQARTEQHASALNLQRLRQSQEYISYLNPSESLQDYSQHARNTRLDLAIGVVSVKRTHSHYELGYLIQVMAQLDKLFKEDKYFDKKVVYLCNTHAGPDKHVEADDLSNYFLYRKRFDKNNPSEAILDPFEKEKRDYVFCMQQALEWNPKYVLILEDDAFPRQNLFPVLYNLLLRVEDRLAPWSYVKLYYPERWEGYSFKVRHLTELLIMTLTGAGFLQYLCGKLCNDATKRVKRKIFYVSFLYFILLFLAVGRPYLIKWRHLHPFLHSLLFAPKCCTPAMVYHRNIIHPIMKYLNETTCSSFQPIDQALDQFSMSRNLEMYLAEPNLIDHIGLFSTIKGGAKYPEEFV